MIEPLGLLGMGRYLPDSVDVAAYVRQQGGDPTDYRGWRRACHATHQDHPSTMGQAALEAALRSSGVTSSEIDLVIFSGVSRDYPASWSVSNEIIKRCKIGSGAIGLDLMAGCLATLAAFDLAHGWLNARGGGLAAIVSAERWTETIDYRDKGSMGLWGYGDGAAAAVVGIGSSQPAIFEYVGAEFRNASGNNGQVRIKYGGTRHPIAPAGVRPNQREMGSMPREKLIASYREGYAKSQAALKARFKGIVPSQMVCNQLTPGMLSMIGEGSGLGKNVIITGHDTGHLGGPDLLIGIESLVGMEPEHEAVLLAASAAYGFGAGYIVRPDL